MSARAASQQAPQTAIDHLHELWRRCMYCVGLLVVGGIVGYVFRQDIIAFLQRPLNKQLYYTSPMGSFNFVMQLCLLIGFMLALPAICYNLLRFIEPALSKRLGKRLVFTVLLSSCLLAIAGAAFAYYLTLPAALRFFGTVGTNHLQALISVNQYFSFVLGYVGTFAAVFQLPLLLLLINHITPFKPGGLRKARKFVFVGAFAISLIMPSSPDPLSQISLAIPIILLYEVSELVVWLMNCRKRRVHQTALAVESVPLPQQSTLPVTAVKPEPAMPLPVRSAVKPIAATPMPKKALDVFMPANRRAMQPRRDFQQPVRRQASFTPVERRQSLTPGSQLISDILT